jgi:hypothetical protein
MVPVRRGPVNAPHVQIASWIVRTANSSTDYADFRRFGSVEWLEDALISLRHLHANLRQSASICANLRTGRLDPAYGIGCGSPAMKSSVATRSRVPPALMSLAPAATGAWPAVIRTFATRASSNTTPANE